MPQQAVRMSATNRPRRAIIAVIAVAAVAAAIAFMGFGWHRGARSMEKNGACAGDVECGAGRVCARGGCLPLIGTESAADWRASLDAQLSPQSAWRPRPSYGEKWVFADVCPIPLGPAEPLEEAKLSLVHQTRVFEILSDRLRIHVQRREKGERWLEAMRLVVPVAGAIDPKRVCASGEVSQVEIARGRPGTLNVGLKQTVPAGAIAAATVSVETELPPAGRDGLRTLKIPLEPAAEGAIAVTAAAVPLGTDVARMGGPAPYRQRLLAGHAVYYWRHANERATAAIAFDLRTAGGTELSMEEIKP